MTCGGATPSPVIPLSPPSPPAPPPRSGGAIPSLVIPSFHSLFPSILFPSMQDPESPRHGLAWNGPASPPQRRPAVPGPAMDIVNGLGTSLLQSPSMPPIPPAPAGDRPTVFLSYSHQDRLWLEPLSTMLAPPIRTGAAGVRWDGQV